MKTHIFKNALKILAYTAVLGGGLLMSGCDQGGNVAQKVEAAHKRNDGPAIWKITDSNSTLYLYGSVHLLADGVDWQRRDMQAAFDEVGTMYFEIPDSNKANLEATVLQREHGLYESGDRLSNHLDIPAQKHFAAAAYNVGLQPDRLGIFKPWLANDILSVAIAQEGGLKVENSVDTVMRAKARAAGKAIKTLDEMRTYIEAAALQPDWVQVEALEQSLKGFDTFAADLKQVNGAWLVGNDEWLAANLLEPAQKRSPEMYAALFTNRNEKWSQILDDFMQGDGNAMVVAGVGHMVGRGGLPSLMRELGYDVERVRRFDLPNN